MWTSSLDVGLSLGGVSFSASIPLAQMAAAFQGLSDSNDERRARDADPELIPCRSVRVVCPHCSAGIFSLELVERSDGWARACRRCHTEFPLGI